MKRKASAIRMTRRQWLRSGSAGAVTGLLGASPAAKADAAKTGPWIDAHSHIWSRDVDRFPLAEGATLDDLDPPSFTAEELLAVAHRQEVGRVVLIQHHIFHGWDNSILIAAARRYPDTFRAVGMVDNFSTNPGRQMRELLEQKVTGIRITPWIYRRKWLAGGMSQMWDTAARTGQKICCLIDPVNIVEVDALCAKHPDTPVVIDHFARIGVDGSLRTQDVDALCRLARYRHTYVKVSAFYALGAKKSPYLDLVPMIRRLLDAFGPPRLMWASDSPYQLQNAHSYADSIGLIRDTMENLTDGDRDWLLRRTAEDVFFYV